MSKNKVKSFAATPKKPAPRPVEEIQKEYEICRKTAADLGFQVAVNKENITRIYQKMFALNQEAKDAGASPVGSAQ